MFSSEGPELLKNEFLNLLMRGYNKRSNILKQINLQLNACLSMFGLLLPPGMKGLKSSADSSFVFSVFVSVFL